jgi:hypothetical protein
MEELESTPPVSSTNDGGGDTDDLAVLRSNSSLEEGNTAVNALLHPTDSAHNSFDVGNSCEGLLYSDNSHTMNHGSALGDDSHTLSDNHNAESAISERFNGAERATDSPSGTGADTAHDSTEESDSLMAAHHQESTAHTFEANNQKASNDDLFQDDDLYQICYDDEEEDDDMFFEGEDLDFMEEDVSVSALSSTSTANNEPSQQQHSFPHGSSPSLEQSTDNHHIDHSNRADSSNTTTSRSQITEWQRRNMDRMKQPRTTARQPWHNEASDKQHRQTMILEM